MSILSYRFNKVETTSAAGNLQPASSYTVVAYAAGAQVTSVAGATITVRAGHGFANGQKCMVNTDTTKYAVVSNVAATQLDTTPALVVVAGDYLVNLGADGGLTSPDFDGSSVTIYSDMDGTTAVTESTLTTNSDGEYGYWYGASRIWELVLSGSTPLQLLPDAVVPAETVRYANQWATDGAGTSGDPWTGWELAVSAANSDDGGVVRFPKGYYETSSTLTLGRYVSIVGDGMFNSFIVASSSFPVDTPLITLGTSNIAFGTLVRDVTLDCNSISGSIGVYSKRVNEGGGVVRTHITHVMSKGIHFEADLSPVPQQWTIEDVMIWFDSSAPATAIGIHIDGNGPSWHCFRGVSVDVTPNLSFLGSGSRAILIENTYGLISDIEHEDVDIGIECGTGSQGTLITGVRGGVSSGIGTAAVNIINDSTASPTVVIGARRGAYTNTVQDLLRSVTLTDSVIGFYNSGEIRTNTITRAGASTFVSTVTIEGALTLSNNTDVNYTLTFNSSTADGTLQYLGASAVNEFSFNKPVRVTGEVRAGGDTAGLASHISLTNVSNTTVSTGAGSILMCGATPRNSTGFIKVYIGTSAYYVPVFTTITG